MRIGLIAFSEKGFLLGERLKARFMENGDAAELTRCQNGELGAWTEKHFTADDALIFIGSCGIAVRAIAPYVKSKLSDPAVIVADETATYCVSLLSGHIGGANDLAVKIAECLHAVPVVTTATDRNGVFAVDSWAKSQDMAIVNPERIKWISARLLEGEAIRLKSLYPIEGTLPDGIILCGACYDVLISHRTSSRKNALRLVPPVITVGVGCRKGVQASDIEEAVSLALKNAGCHPAAVKALCSIDMKAQEAGLLEFCRIHRLPFHTFSVAALAAAPGKFTGSDFVRSVTGVDNVCERSAVLGSGGRLLAKKYSARGVTVALAAAPYMVRFGEEMEK